jgi:hypothetical protein
VSEGKSHVGARGQRESSPAMGGGTARTRSSHTRKPRTPARQTTKQQDAATRQRLAQC